MTASLARRRRIRAFALGAGIGAGMILGWAAVSSPERPTPTPTYEHVVLQEKVPEKPLAEVSLETDDVAPLDTTSVFFGRRDSPVGRHVVLEGLEVLSVVDPGTFYVRPQGMADVAPLLVTMDDEPPVETAAHPTVDAGERVTVRGTIRATDALPDDGLALVDDTAEDEVQAARDDLYFVHGEALEVR